MSARRAPKSGTRRFGAPLHVLAQVELIRVPRQAAVAAENPTSVTSSWALSTSARRTRSRFPYVEVVMATSSIEPRHYLTGQPGISPVLHTDRRSGPITEPERAICATSFSRRLAQEASTDVPI